MRAALVVVACLAVRAGAARADQDPFLQLHQDARWYYEVAEGPSIAALKPVAGAPRATCRLLPAPAGGAVATLTCEPSGSAGGGRFAQVVHQSHRLVFDAAGIRELRRETDDPAQLADRSNAGAFTFPKQLPPAGWTHDAKAADGSRAQIAVRAERATVRGKPATIWLAEARYTAKDATERAAAALVPSGAPALLCAVAGTDAKPQYTCLRLVEPTQDEQARDRADVLGGGDAPDTGALSKRRDPLSEGAASRPPPGPQARIAWGSKQAQDKSSLKADAVASKISSAYVASVQRCYRDVLRKKPTAGGSLKLTFTVNAVGKTEGATVTGVDPALDSCVRTLIAAWRFPIPMSEYGEPRTARFTFELKLSAG